MGHDHDHDHDHACACPPATATVLEGPWLLRIPAMDCPAEEAQIRQALERVPGIRRLQVDLPGRTLALDAPDDSRDDIVRILQDAGFRSETVSAPPLRADTARAQRAEQVRLIAALAVAAGAEAVHFLAPDTLGWRIAGMGFACVAIVLSGLTVFHKGLAALLRGQLNIHALMTVAVSGAFLIGQWPEAAMVMTLYSLAELIEARAAERARDAITGLLSLAPPQAEVLQADGRWVLADAKSVAVGARVRIRPGERLALDGRVTAGQGAVDQSPVTGESIPVDKGPGDEVYAGSVNQTGSMEIEVTRPAGDTVLARIIQAIEQAQGQRAPTQRFVDRFAAIYTPAVFLVALLVAIGAPWVLGWPAGVAVYKALVLLVIACPCALVISTPVTVVSGLAAAARCGILFKGGVHLEQAHRLKIVAMDKTGTLTTGRPSLVAWRMLVDDLPEPAVRHMAHSLAARSDHPVSKAVADGLGGEAGDVEDFGAQPGRGIRGRIAGRDLVLGNVRWIEERGQGSPGLTARMQDHESRGHSVTLLADGERVLALFAVSDTIRDGSRQAVAELAALGVRVLMLTGDNRAAATTIAQQLGIADVSAGLLPEDKLARVRQLAGSAAVAMVGDGINDGPAMSAATLAFGMGGAGSGTAMEAADVVIMNDDLRRIPQTIRLSRATRAVLWQNILLALGIKLVFLVLALFGDASMWMAVFADMGASLLVVFNGLRLLKTPLTPG